MRARWWIAGLILAGAVGVAHIPAARPLLSWLNVSAGCPVSLDSAGADELEAIRVGAVGERRGEREASSRPALAFELGTTRRGEVQQTLASQPGRCRSTNRGAVLRCHLFQQARRRAPLDVHLQFDASDRLVAVDIWHPPGSAQSLLDALSRKTGELKRRVGPATDRQGRLDARFLAGQPLSRVAREHRYHDYVARLSVTNLGQRGIRFREQYQWVPPKI